MDKISKNVIKTLITLNNKSLILNPANELAEAL